MTQPTRINFHLREYGQGLRYSSLAVNLVNTLQVEVFLMIYLIQYVPDKTEDLNLNVFNMITRINKSRT